VDYTKLKSYLEKQTHLHVVYYYTGKVGLLEKQIGFIKKLEKLGFYVVTKEVKFIKTERGKTVPKGNLDVELALDAFRTCSEYKTILLFSGDSDFAYLIDLLKKQGKRVVVFSTRGHISKDLLDRAKYIDLRKLKQFIEYK